MTNQRAIARQLGMTQATVSRALRGDKNISEETRRKVHETAERMGYKVNPLISTLMEQVRSGRKVTDQGCIAVLGDARCQAEWFVSETYKLQFEGFQKRAERRGFRLECFYLREESATESQLDRILHARGIQGLILAAPMAAGRSCLDLSWERYASATVSYVWDFLPVDRVSTNHRHNVDRAYGELVARGYQRIGLSLSQRALNPKDCNWLAGFLAQQYLHPHLEPLPVFVNRHPSSSLKEFRGWYDQWRPDALISLLGEELEWLSQLGISPQRETALVCLNRPLDTDLAGVEENNVFVGELTCDVVVNHITHNELGLPGFPRLVLVDGIWVDGETLPAHKPGTKRRSRHRSAKVT